MVLERLWGTLGAILGRLGTKFGGLGATFGALQFFIDFWSDFGVLKKVVLQRNDFLVRIQGDPSCPNDF